MFVKLTESMPSLSSSKNTFAAFSLVAFSILCALPANAQNVIQLPDSLYATGDTVAWVKPIPAYCEGPAWDSATGNVFFTRQMASGVANWPIWRVKPGVDTGEVFIANAYQANGIEFDGQGRLVVAQNGRLTRYLTNGTLDSTLVVSPANSVTFNQANDLSIGSNGGIYFTALGSNVYYLSPTRQLSIATTNIQSANGIEWIEEENAVYVHQATNTSPAGAIYRFTIGAGGSLTNRTLFASLPVPDGGTLDIHGNRYIASWQLGEVRVFNAAGDSIGRIALRTASGTYNTNTGNTGNTSNTAFGNVDRKTLYITGDGGLYSIRLKIPGRLPAQAPPVSIRALVNKHRQSQGIEPLREIRDALGRTVEDARLRPILKAVQISAER